MRVPQAGARTRLGLAAQGHGVFVTRLDPACPAAQAGLQRGDVIESIGRRPVRRADEFVELASDSKGEVLLRVNRRGNTFFLLVSPGAR